MSKGLLLLFLGAFVAWLLISFFTKEYSAKDLFIFIIASTSGYQIAKKEKK